MTEPGYLSQLVDQLDRLQLERVTSMPALSVELQLDRLQLERANPAGSYGHVHVGVVSVPRK